VYADVCVCARVSVNISTEKFPSTVSHVRDEKFVDEVWREERKSCTAAT